MDKKTEKYLLIGGGVLIAGYFLYQYYQQQQAAQAAAAAAPSTTTSASATTVPTSTPAASTAPAAPELDEPTQAGAITAEILAVNAYNEWGAYNVIFQLQISNNMDVDAQLEGVQGQASFTGQTEQSAMSSSQPFPYTGILGQVNDATSVTIPAGLTATKWYKVIVPVNSATNLYVANLAYFLAEDTIKAPGSDPFTFQGNITISGSQVPVTLKYAV
jgi:hypothetical protein